MAHTKPPTFPVRHNRRTSMRPSSLLNGDNLPMLKKIRSSEMAQRVQGHNAALDEDTKRVVNQWFNEEKFTIEKFRKEQYEAYYALSRLHLEKRQLRRAMIKWREEEARNQLRMEKEDEKRQKEKERIDREIARMSDESKQQHMKKQPAAFAQNMEKFSKIQSRIDTGLKQKKAVVEKETKENENKGLEKVFEEEEEEEEQEVEMSRSLAMHDLQRLQNMYNSAVGKEEEKEEEEKEVKLKPKEVETKSRVLVATRMRAGGPPEPLVRTRTGSFIKDEEEAVIDSITKANEGRVSPKKDRVKLAPLDEQTQQQFYSPAEGEFSRAKVLPRKSLADVMRSRKKQKEEYLRSILEEPFKCYRRDAKGKLQEIGRPLPFKTDCPSAKGRYEREKRREDSKKKYADSMNELRKHTALMVHQDIVQLHELENPVVIDDTKKLDENFAEESHAVGPAAWLKVFVHSSLPKDVDPMSFEAMESCRYLRNDDDDDIAGEIVNLRDSPELDEEDKALIRKNRERRTSSWQI